MAENYSGVAWYAFNLLQALLALDKNNQYIFFYNNAKPVNLPVFNQSNVSYRGFQYSNKLLSLSFNFLNRPKIDKMIGGVDVFFMPNINFCALSSNCRRVITVHDLSFLRYPYFYTLKSRLWHQNLLAKKIIQQADAIIAVSDSTKNDLIDLLNIEAGKIKVIAEGVDGKFQPTDNQIELARVKKRYKLPEKFLLFLGTLEPRKNIESIISAFNQLKTDHYLVIGGDRGWKSKTIRDLAAKNAKIKIIGYVAEEDKRGLYSLADIFVYPSYYEGFGLPLIEAMACGVPVIAGSNSSQAEVINSAGLLVDPYNVNEIKQAIEFILQDEVLRDKLIKNGLARAKAYNWAKTAQATLDVFKNLEK